MYSHFAIDDPFERMAPTLVFFFMLVCRMVVDWQFVKQTAEKVNRTADGAVLYFTLCFPGRAAPSREEQLRQGEREALVTPAGQEQEGLGSNWVITAAKILY